MNFPDIETLVGSFLRDRVSVEVTSRVPKDRPAKFVRVWRTGGAALNRVLDRPMITVQAWAPDDGQSFELANACRELIFNNYTVMPLVRGVEEVTGLYFDPDPATGVDRYTFSIQLQARAKR